jgi:Mg2+ and Co2+ transporter CorA
MWILSDQLIITSLPQQWNLPGDDHLNVLEGIINDIKNRSKETVPVRSVVDLASIISGRCIGTFESRVVKERDYPFLDKFESAVSGTNEQVDELFRQFNSDSWRASEWLKQQRGSSNRFLKTSEEKKVLPDDNYSVEPECVDRLLDINPETKLLDHIQSLRDEFQLLASVLANQSVLISEFVGKIRVSREDTCTLKDYAEKQLAMIRTHSRDIERMQHQTDSIHASITNLLDLKHRYANVFEARFARYQATDTVHQGQTIMVFTIVTVIFLPLSFIGTLFTINISDFPQGNGGEPSMPLAYVSKRVFGIGFAISIPLVILALSYGSVMQFVRERQRRIRERWERKPTATPEIEEADWREIVDGTTGGSAEFNVLSTAKKRRTNAIKEEV